ncbi:MAG: ATP-binding protein [Vicinamibacterales bacterium]
MTDVSQLRRYGLSVGAVVLVTLIGLLLQTVAETNPIGFLIYAPPILLAATVGGLGPTLMATLLGGLAAEFFLRRPYWAWPDDPSEWVPMMLYLVVGFGVSLLADNLARVRNDVQAQSAQLEGARREMERLSRDAARRAKDFETLFEVAPIGIGVSQDPDGRQVVLNPALARLLGLGDIRTLDASAGVYRPFQVQKQGVSMPVADLPLQRAARLGVEIREPQIDVLLDDGRRVSLDEFAAPLFDEQGHVRGAIGVFLDITERQRADQEQRFLIAASTVLASSLDSSAALAGLVRLAVPELADWCTLDVVGRDGSVERTAWAHADPEMERHLERLVRERFPVRSEQGLRTSIAAVADARAVLFERVTVEQIREMAWDADHAEQLLHLGWTSSIVVPLVQQGRVVAALAWVRGPGRPQYDARDLSLAQELARRAATAVENARLYREAQEANRLKDEFLATLSHEMRTPLNALLGWIQLLKSDQLAPARRTRALEAIDRSARLQAQLTADLLDVSRAITGKLRLDPQDVVVGALIEGAIESLRPAADLKHLSLRLEIPAGIPPLVLDPERLQQIVWNVLSNAIKFTPTGGAIVVGLALEDEELVFTVRDTGVGIRQEFLPFVFDRFRQADGGTTREHGGLGLGLAIVRHLVELHGGTVSASSDGPGLGATFTVRLPAVPATSHPEPLVATRDDRTRLDGLTVLFVDDDPESRDLVSELLEEHGVLVTAVAGVPDAWEVFVTDHPHVVVTDLAMPQEDGYSLLARIRALGIDEGGGTPVVALTAHARPEDRAAALAAGFQAYLTKPLDASALIATLAGLRSP